MQFIFSNVQNPNTAVAESHTELGCQLRLRHITSQRAENELAALLD
jgi:hypothetical protein